MEISVCIDSISMNTTLQCSKTGFYNCGIRFDDWLVGCMYMIQGRRPGHEVLKNATCPSPAKVGPTQEVVHDDESGCNEDRFPVKGSHNYY